VNRTEASLFRFRQDNGTAAACRRAMRYHVEDRVILNRLSGTPCRVQFFKGPLLDGPQYGAFARRLAGILPRILTQLEILCVQRAHLSEQPSEKIG
jgi:hypothetical protein